MQENHEYYMRIALDEAKKALEHEDVPIGSIIVHEDKIIAKAYNQVEKLGDATAHAESLAIREAISKIDYKHLLDSTLYTSLEPCTMCAGSIVLARVKNLVIGAKDPKAGASGSVFSLTDSDKLNHRCNVITGVLEEECSQIIKDFFKMLRQRKK